MHIWISAIVLFIVSFAPLAAAAKSEQVQLMEAVNDSLAITADAHVLLNKPAKNDVKDLANTQVAILELHEAALQFSSFATSGDETIRKVAEAFALVYGSLREDLERNVALREKLMRLEAQVSDGKAVDVRSQIAELSIESIKIRASIWVENASAGYRALDSCSR